jgi:hypothetical protein
LTQCHVGKYWRNTDTVNWNFCLVRQHGSVTTTCTKISIVYAQNKLSVFNCYSNQCIWHLCSPFTLHTFKQKLTSQAQPPFLSSCPNLITPASFKFCPTLYRCIYNGLENSKIRGCTKARTWLLCHCQTNVTLQQSF